MQPLWYRNAVIYQIDVAQFHDASGDGWGDLRGVTARLEHARGLGANAVWLLPFYRTPYRDGGYDLIDHLTVDPRFGDLADVAMLMDKADDLGLRVIVDLIAQHTSVDHPWFQKARRDRDSPYRDYYVWADEPDDTDVEPIFPTIEDSVWTWDDVAGQYYRHVFYSHEPDLEVGNPAVVHEIDRIMAFWLRMGVAGFRVDALPYMVERAGAAARDDGQRLVEHLHDFVALRRPDAVLLGEVDVPIEEYDDYFGGGRGMSMLLDFWSNNHTFLALARGEAEPLARALGARSAPPPRGQFGTFLRNHDELDLERLSEEEQKEVVECFAPEESMRAYGRGIRRRLAPMLGGDDRRLAMAHALLMSLPGAPVLLYGDEIGMGDDLDRPERMSVRTPMQWSAITNAGFSTADRDALVADVLTGGPFGYEERNVHEQTMRPDSLLARVGNIVRTRVGRHELGFGECRVLDVEPASVLCLLHEWEARRLVALVNLADTDVEVALPTDVLGEVRLVDVLADEAYERPDPGDLRVMLRGYGYRWLQRPEDLFG